MLSIHLLHPAFVANGYRCRQEHAPAVPAQTPRSTSARKAGEEIRLALLQRGSEIRREHAPWCFHHKAVPFSPQSDSGPTQVYDEAIGAHRTTLSHPSGGA